MHRTAAKRTECQSNYATAAQKKSRVNDLIKNEINEINYVKKVSRTRVNNICGICLKFEKLAINFKGHIVVNLVTDGHKTSV